MIVGREGGTLVSDQMILKVKKFMRESCVGVAFSGRL